MRPPPLKIGFMSSMLTSRPGKRRFNPRCDFHDAALVAFGTTVTPSSSALTMAPGLDGNLTTG